MEGGKLSNNLYKLHLQVKSLPYNHTVKQYVLFIIMHKEGNELSFYACLVMKKYKLKKTPGNTLTQNFVCI